MNRFHATPHKGRTGEAIALLAILAVAPSLLASRPAVAQPVAGEDSLLLLQFDGQGKGDFGRGSPAGLLGAAPRTHVPGRFGQSLHMEDGERISLGIALPHLPEATIDFWMRPDWSGDTPQRHSCFHASYDPRCYVTINSLGKGRLGIAMSNPDAQGEIRWRRVDGDISAWKAGQWHHVAFTWGQGRLRVYLDGQESPKQVDDACMPGKPFDEITLQGFGGAIDGLRISRRLSTAEDVRRWLQQADDPPYRRLEELAWQPIESAQADRIRLPNRAHVPLLIGDRVYVTGLASQPDTKLTFVLDRPYEALEADVGADSLGTP